MGITARSQLDSATHPTRSIRTCQAALGSERPSDPSDATHAKAQPATRSSPATSSVVRGDRRPL